jgi:hypothetical protein
MDTTSLLLAAVGAAVGAAISWFVANARFGRRADVLKAQIDKAEKSRQQSAQMWQQARREVEQLQKDALARGVPVKPSAAPERDLEAEKRDRTAAAEALLATTDGAPSVLPHGFADTQPMTTPGRL